MTDSFVQQPAANECRENDEVNLLHERRCKPK